MSLFTNKTKPQQHLYKTDIGVLKAKKDRNIFCDHNLEAQKAVFYKQHQRARLNEVFSEVLQKEKPEIPCNFFSKTNKAGYCKRFL